MRGLFPEAAAPFPEQPARFKETQVDGKSKGPSFSNGPDPRDWRLRELNAAQVTHWQLV